jgi:arylsulfatase A-like enzyme
MKSCKLYLLFFIFAFTISACDAKTTPAASPDITDGTPAPYAPTLFDVESDAKAGQARLDDPRPNIIFVLTDDQPYETVQFMPTVRDVLIKNGVNFENGFITTPLCCPSRASILTGEYVHNHEVYTDRMPLGGAPKLDDSSTIATWLQDAGYRTGYYGKYLNDYDALTPAGYVPPGWDEWGVFLGRNLTDDDTGSTSYYSDYSLSENGKIVEYSKDKAVFGADLITRKSVDFISATCDKPFFLYVSYYNPHSPYQWAERDNDQFRANSALQAPPPYRPPSFMEKDINDKPQYLKDLNPISVEKIDISYKQILRSLLSVDDGVASILNALDKTNLNRKTIIVYLTDNGLTVGDHRLGLTKNCPYESCIRTPFIVYAPGIFPARSDAHLVANIDIAPTFAEIAGATAPSTVNGLSLLPLLKDAGATWRDDILFEHWPTEAGIGSKIPEFYAVRTSEWKYVEYSTGEKELYDLKNDPYELDNLAGQAQYAATEAELKIKLDALKTQ